jgi:hypothetical protein
VGWSGAELAYGFRQLDARGGTSTPLAPLELPGENVEAGSLRCHGDGNATTLCVLSSLANEAPRGAVHAVELRDGVVTALWRHVVRGAAVPSLEVDWAAGTVYALAAGAGFQQLLVLDAVTGRLLNQTDINIGSMIGQGSTALCGCVTAVCAWAGQPHWGRVLGRAKFW